MKQRLLIALGALAVATTPLAAQNSLARVEELTRLGHAEEARTVLMRWWEEEEGSASRRELQRALWLRGRLTVDPVQAELDFQRLAVLYPSGEYTPDALLRLAQGAYAMGDEAAARRYVATLERDYPRSGARERAVSWLADAGPVPPRGAPTATPDAAPPTQVRVVRPGGDGPARDSTPPSPARGAPGSDPAPAPAGSMSYHVQLGAFADAERALSLFEEVRAAGVDARIVRVEGSRFTHVRVGRFAQREAAVELLDELAARGMDGALVRDDRPESPIRD
jgi:cell division septation protein DedD